MLELGNWQMTKSIGDIRTSANLMMQLGENLQSGIGARQLAEDKVSRQ